MEVIKTKTMKKYGSKLISASLLIILIGQLCVQTFAQTNQEVSPEKRIDALFSNYNSKTPGVAVAVVKDGKIIFKKGYGMANLEYDVSITPSTVFHIASVSKQFTTFSILLLEKEGKLSLDDDVRKYIPEVPDFGKTITLKHLATHTSGIKDQWALLTLAGWRMDDVITTEQILKLISRQKSLNFEPGSKFKYSNSGFTLLAEVVARVSNQSFAEFTQKNIFQPLKMTNTQFYDDHEKIIKNRAYSYAKDGNAYKKQVLSYSNVGATSLFTTVEDLSKWAINFENPTVGDFEIVEKLQQSVKLANGQNAVLSVVDGETIRPAMGQFVRNYRGLDLINHTGGDAGFRAYLVRFPSEKFSVMVFSNDADFSSLQTGLKIAKFYLNDKLKPKIPENKAVSDTSKKTVPSTASINFSDFVGRYHSQELSTDYTVIARNEKLTLTHNRLSDTELSLVGKDKFAGKIWFPVEVEFYRDNKKNITGFSISNFGAENVSFDKVE